MCRFGKDNSTNNFTLIKWAFHFQNWKDVESFTSLYQLLGQIDMQTPQAETDPFSYGQKRPIKANYFWWCGEHSGKHLEKLYLGQEE